MQMIALRKNGLDVFSALCYFFAMILPALQGPAAASASALLDGKNDTVLRFAVIVEQQLFYSKVIGAGKADDAYPRQLRLARILFKFPGGILVRTRCGGKDPATGRRSAPLG